MALTVPTLAFSVHPDSENRWLNAFEVDVTREQSFLCKFRFRALGDIAAVRLPRPAAPSRRNELWKHTCFEVFLMCSDGSYYEFNFAPSSQWAAYRFDAYRQGMAKLELPSPPRIDIAATAKSLTLDATIDLRGLRETGASAAPRMALAAVIEGCDGQLCYWAMAHPPGKPDFHHADGFVGVLPDNVV